MLWLPIRSINAQNIDSLKKEISKLESIEKLKTDNHIVIYLDLIKQLPKEEQHQFDSLFNDYMEVVKSDSLKLKGFETLLFRYYEIGNDIKLVEYSAKLLETLPHMPRARHRAYTNFGIAKHNDLNYKECLPLFYKAWQETIMNVELQQRRSTSAMNYANALSDYGLIDSATAIYKDVLQNNPSNDNLTPTMQGIMSANLGSMYWESNKDSAIKYYTLAETHFALLNDRVNMALCTYNIGTLNLRIGNIKTSQQKLLKAKSIYDSLELSNMQSSVYHALSLTEALSGNLNGAIKLHVEGGQYFEKALANAGSEATAEAQARFNLAEKEYKNKLLKSEMITIKARNNVQQIIVVFVLIILLVGIVFTYQVTKNRKAIQKLNLSLKAKNKNLDELIHEKDNLMQILVHDIRSPIAGINNAANMIQSNNSELDNETKAELIKELISSSNSGLKLINSIWDVYEIENTKNVPLEEFPIKTMIEAFVSEYRMIANKRNIDLKLNCGDIVIKSNANYLTIIIRNLILNALKFSPSHSLVTLSCCLHNDVPIISIKDQGPGFSDLDRKKMFKKFSKLSAKPLHGDKSSGLGLYLVNTICQKLNIDIELNEKYADGSEFVLTINT
jgi:signal transduction histidine kinase